MMSVDNPNHNLDPKHHFIVKTSGDSMSWGNNPIFDGNLLLMEINTGGSISNQIFAVEYITEFGETEYVLKRIEKDGPNQYRLVSSNKEFQDINVNPKNMFPVARFKYKLEMEL